MHLLPIPVAIAVAEVWQGTAVHPVASQQGTSLRYWRAAGNLNLTRKHPLLHCLCKELMFGVVLEELTMLCPEC